MTFSIYALRAKGDIEVRYIGQTSKTPESRIYYETSQARSRTRSPDLGVGSFHQWLLDNEVEGIVLATAATKAEACAKEREMAEAFANLDHRLFNRWLLPANRRFVEPLRRKVAA